MTLILYSIYHQDEVVFHSCSSHLASFRKMFFNSWLLNDLETYLFDGTFPALNFADGFSFLQISMTAREKDVWMIFDELPKTHICTSRSHEDDFSSKCCCEGASDNAFPPALHVRTSTHADYNPVNELALVFVLGLESKALYYLSFQGDLFISMHHSFKTSVFLHIAWATTSNSCPMDGPANTFQHWAKFFPLYPSPPQVHALWRVILWCYVYRSGPSFSKHGERELASTTIETYRFRYF